MGNQLKRQQQNKYHNHNNNQNIITKSDQHSSPNSHKQQNKSTFLNNLFNFQQTCQCQCQTLDNTCRRDKFKNDIKPRQKLDLSKIKNLANKQENYMERQKSVQKENQQELQNIKHNKSKQKDIINANPQKSILEKKNQSKNKNINNNFILKKQLTQNVPLKPKIINLQNNVTYQGLVFQHIEKSQQNKNTNNKMHNILQGEGSIHWPNGTQLSSVKFQNNQIKGNIFLKIRNNSHNNYSEKKNKQKLKDSSSSQFLQLQQKSQLYSASPLNLNRKIFQSYQGNVQNNMANGYGIAIIKSKIKVKRKKTGIKKEEAGLQEISQSQNSYFNQFQQQFQEIQIQEKYQGQWKNDAPHGNGKHIMKDGSIYQGNFKNGIKSGSGRYQLSKSSNNASTKFQSHNRKTVLYEGQFLDNMFHGEGVLNWESQQKSSQQEFQHQSLYLMKLKYIGQWKYGKMNGQGKLYYPDKSFYEGNFRENLREGHGKYVYADGRSWVGQWSDNRQNGRGVYIKPRKTLNKVQKNDKNNKNQGQFEQIHGIWKDGIQIPVSYDVSQVNIQVQ